MIRMIRRLRMLRRLSMLRRLRMLRRLCKPRKGLRLSVTRTSYIDQRARSRNVEPIDAFPSEDHHLR